MSLYTGNNTLIVCRAVSHRSSLACLLNQCVCYVRATKSQQQNKKELEVENKVWREKRVINSKQKRNVIIDHFLQH